jgi:DNA polymerase III epsilon subunit-like protein
MRFLVFDTETTGLAPDCGICDATLHLWPYIVQFSYVIYDSSLNEIVESKDYIIKMPSNVTIPKESITFHGITDDISQSKGVYINHVLNEFCHMLTGVDRLIGHNIEFDLNMVKVEMRRILTNNMLTRTQLESYNRNNEFINNFTAITCTLKDSIQFCNIKRISKLGKSYLKYPKLAELHEKLFNTTPINLHNSFNDVLVTLRCFMKLKHNIDLQDNCETFKTRSSLIFP